MTETVCEPGEGRRAGVVCHPAASAVRLTLDRGAGEPLAWIDLPPQEARGLATSLRMAVDLVEGRTLPPVEVFRKLAEALEQARAAIIDADYALKVESTAQLEIDTRNTLHGAWATADAALKAYRALEGAREA